MQMLQAFAGVLCSERFGVGSFGRRRGYLCGSEGRENETRGPGSRAGPGCADRRQSFFYQKNCWVIPLEALRDMEKLPGKERLLAMPPYKNTDLSDETTDVD
jgi:hypothetical protein